MRRSTDVAAGVSRVICRHVQHSFSEASSLWFFEQCKG
jgi:hypothetical protein